MGVEAEEGGGGGQGGGGTRRKGACSEHSSGRRNRKGRPRGPIKRGGKSGRERRRRAPEGGTCRNCLQGGRGSSPEENEDLPDFSPERAHLLLQGVYAYFLHHNNRLHLDGRVLYDAVWKRRWRRLAAQLDIWYATPSGAVERQFTAILAAEFQGVLNVILSSERPLVFVHAIITKTLGV